MSRFLNFLINFKTTLYRLGRKKTSTFKTWQDSCNDNYLKGFNLTNILIFTLLKKKFYKKFNSFFYMLHVKEFLLM